jgi:hypothetical protein
MRYRQNITLLVYPTISDKSCLYFSICFRSLQWLPTVGLPRCCKAYPSSVNANKCCVGEERSPGCVCFLGLAGWHHTQTQINCTDSTGKPGHATSPPQPPLHSNLQPTLQSEYTLTHNRCLMTPFNLSPSTHTHTHTHTQVCMSVHLSWYLFFYIVSLC